METALKEHLCPRINGFTVAENFRKLVQSALRKEKPAKGMDQNGLFVEVFQEMPTLYTDVPSELWVACGRLRQVSRQWRIAAVVLIHKR